MVIVKAFDQAIWYLKIIFAWGHSVPCSLSAEFTMQLQPCYNISHFKG